MFVVMFEVGNFNCDCREPRDSYFVSKDLIDSYFVSKDLRDSYFVSKELRDSCVGPQEHGREPVADLAKQSSPFDLRFDSKPAPFCRIDLLTGAA